MSEINYKKSHATTSDVQLCTIDLRRELCQRSTIRKSHATALDVQLCTTDLRRELCQRSTIKSHATALGVQL